MQQHASATHHVHLQFSVRCGVQPFILKWLQRVPRTRSISLASHTRGIGDPGVKGCALIRTSAEFRDRRGHPVHAAEAAAYRDLETWPEAEVSRGDYSAPAITTRQLAAQLTGILSKQLITGNRSHGEALPMALPAVLAAGRRQSDGIGNQVWFRDGSPRAGVDDPWTSVSLPFPLRLERSLTLHRSDNLRS